MGFLNKLSRGRLATGRNPQRGKAGARAYAVGDIHGRLDLLDRLLDRIEADIASRPPKRNFIVFLGDLIDRGPDSAGVVERLRTYSPSYARPIFLAGNHEEVLLRMLAGEKRIMPSWLKFGGAECARSYGIDPTALQRLDEEAALQLLQTKVPRAHRDFLESFADTFRFGDYLFVHAGIRPGIALEEQDRFDLRWIREPFLTDAKDHGFTVVHGHTIVDRVEERPNRIAIDTGAYHSGILTALAMEDGQRWYLKSEMTPERGSLDRVLDRTLSETLDEPSLETIEALIPNQSESPIKFRIYNETVTIDSQPREYNQSEKEHLEAARQELQEQLSNISAELCLSNCDRRLTAASERLEAMLASRANIIALGIHAQTFTELCSQLRHEVPDAVTALVVANGSSLRMYLAQFAEWNRFVENAAHAEILQTDVKALSEIAKRTADELDNSSNLAQPEVPFTLRLLEEALRNPGLAGKRAAYGLFRTLENFVIELFRYFTDYLRKTGTKTVESLSSGTSRIIAGGLISLAVWTALSLSPIAYAIPGAQWLESVAQMVAHLLP